MSHIINESKSIKRQTLIITGDAVPSVKFKNSLNKQLKIVEELGNRGYFIPGYKEWEKVYKGVSEIEKYMQKITKLFFFQIMLSL